jgi:hypothetical protein
MCYDCNKKELKKVVNLPNQFTVEPIPDDLIEEIISDYLENGKSILQLAKDYGINHYRIRRMFKKLGVKIRGNSFNSRKYKYNENFFDVIDTEEKAYWLGFIYADGYITKRGNTYQLGIALSRKDKSHLEKFIKSLDSNIVIRNYTNKTVFKENTEYSRVIISNNHICEQLIKKGCVRRKTDKLIFPSYDIIPKELIHHFIRGYFDGDGCLTGSLHPKRNVYEYQIKIVGTMEMLEGIHKHLPIDKKLYLRQRFNDRNVNNYTLEIGGKKQVERILEYMYNDATIYLDRKYEKYLEFKNQS